MIPPEENRRVFWRAAGGRDVAIVEGMMGLFDGVEGASEEGSSAALAKALGLPVVLVIDAGGAVRSAAATLRGFRDFDPALRLAGVIFNRVAGEGHYEYLRRSVRLPSFGWVEQDPSIALPERHLGLVPAGEHSPDLVRLAGVIFNRVGGPGHLADLTAAATPLGVPVLGGLPWEATVALPERHLGLVTAAEASLGPEAIRRLAALARDRLDLQRLLAETEVPEPRAVAPDSRTVQPRLRVAVARDAAFAFYYRENLTRLAAAGAELVDWSPLADGALPPGTRAVYLGGGYPEVHAARLAANAAARMAVRTFAEAGGVVYAECGGLMYLARTLRTLDGVAHPMCGVLPLAVRMRPTLAALGYVEVTLALGEGPALVARGHLFHHSELEAEAPPELATAYEVREARSLSRWREGYRVGQTLASYVHLHFASCPELPVRLLTLAGDVR